MEVFGVMSVHFLEARLYCQRENGVGETVGLSEKRPP